MNFLTKKHFASQDSFEDEISGSKKSNVDKEALPEAGIVK